LVEKKKKNNLMISLGLFNSCSKKWRKLCYL